MPKVFSKQSLSATDTIVLSELAPANCSEVMFQVETASTGIRYRKDGVLPSASVGELASDGITVVINARDIAKTNIIANSTTTLHMHFTTSRIVTFPVPSFDAQDLNMLVYFDETSITGTGATALLTNKSTGAATGGSAFNVLADVGTGITQSTFNGVLCFNFPGNSNMRPATVQTISQDFTTFMVYETVGPKTWMYDGYDSSGRVFSFLNTTDRVFMSAGTNIILNGWLQNNKYLFIKEFSGTSSLLTVPSIGSLAGNAGTNSLRYITFAGENDDSEFANGNIATFGIIPRIIATDEKTDLIAFMASKYATLT